MLLINKTARNMSGVVMSEQKRPEALREAANAEESATRKEIVMSSTHASGSEPR